MNRCAGMNRAAHGFPHQLCQRRDKLWRIVQACGHFEMRNTQPERLFACFVINLAQRFDVIGDECHGHDANFPDFLIG